MLAKVLVAIVVLTAASFAGFSWFTLHWSYSKGERAGYVQKLSNKGWICKTWEGELLLATMPGAIPEKFEFSVRDDGAGFDPRAVRGLGLLGMEERVRRLGGQVRIDSQPGRGTLVAAELPVAEMAAKNGHDAHSHSLG